MKASGPRSERKSIAKTSRLTQLELVGGVKEDAWNSFLHPVEDSTALDNLQFQREGITKPASFKKSLLLLLAENATITNHLGSVFIYNNIVTGRGEGKGRFHSQEEESSWFDF